ncbi:hypothetical protein J4477_00675 [Candidatus Pacearchaeota archaeon]|nr:hypothetical protein [Candidatus Pacearchaeota archaeon]
MKHDIHEKFNIKKKAFFIYFIFIFSIIIIISLTVITYFSLTNYFIFPDTWTPIKAKYSPIFFFGAISSIFAFFGLISTIKYKNSIILPWFIFSLIQIYLYYILKFNILVPFARLFVFYLIGMSILAGIGVVYIYGNISDYSKKVKYFKNLKYVKIIAILLILTFILINYFLIIKNPLNPPHIINENNYEIFDIIKQNNRSETLVIADGLTSTAIYPLTGSKVMGIIGANLGGGFPERNNDFIYGSCEEKEKGVVDTKNALKKINSTQIKQAILVSNFQQKCPFLEQIYEKDSYLYRINLTD